MEMKNWMNEKIHTEGNENLLDNKIIQVVAC